MERNLGYELDGQRYEGVLVYDERVTRPRPAIFMEPDWDGASAKAVAQAKTIAGTDYVVYVSDMFGVGYAPKSFDERMAASRFVHDDLARSRQRGNTAMDVFLAEGKRLGLVAPGKVAGVGYCFGAGCLFDLAREGRPFTGLVAYHITFPGSADPAGAARMSGEVLLLHGADDPVTTRAALHALESELDAAKIKWQTVMFSGAVHSFCDPDATQGGPTRYDAALAAKCYRLTHEFFREIF